MYFSDEIISKILEKTEETLETYASNQFHNADNIKDAIRLFEELMLIQVAPDSDGKNIDFDSTYASVFVEKFFSADYTDFKDLVSCEGVFKKILKVRNEAKYNAGPDDKPYWQLGDLYGEFNIYKKLKDAGFPGSKYPISETDPEEFTKEELVQEYVWAYQARNAVAHKEKKSEDTWIRMRAAMLRVSLDMCYRFKDVIHKRYAKQILAERFKEKAYIKRIIDGYKDNARKYIMVKWNSVSTTGSHEGIKTEDLIEKNEATQVMKLIGPAGVGKSESMKYMQYKQALEYGKKEGSLLPIYIPLGDLVGNVTLSKRIARELDVEEEYVDAVLECYSCIVYLDGYNEIIDFADRSQAAKDIEKFIDKYDSKFVIADRSDRTNPLCAREALVYQQDSMSEEQIHDFFAKNCLKEDKKTLDEATLRKIENMYDEQLSWLEDGATPLMLISIIEMIQYGTECPEEVDDFYEKYIEYKFEREEDIKKETRLYTLKKCLRHLAGEVLKTDEKVIHEEVAIEFFAKVATIDPREADAMLRLATGMGFLEAKENPKELGWKNIEIAIYFFDGYQDLKRMYSEQVDG